MITETDELRRLLRDLTPQPPDALDLSVIRAHVQRRRRRRALLSISASTFLVIAAAVLPSVLIHEARGAHSDRPLKGASPPAHRPAAPECLARALDMSLTWRTRGLTNQPSLRGALVVTNNTHAACTLSTRPLLSPNDSHGRPLDTVQFQPNQQGPTPWRLFPGANAVSTVSWGGWCGGAAPGRTITVSWPGGGKHLLTADGPPPPQICLNQSRWQGGVLSSDWFVSLSSPPQLGLAVNTPQSFLDGQVRLLPLTKPEGSRRISPLQALALNSPVGVIPDSRNTITVEYGLYEQHASRQDATPAYAIITRTPLLSVPGGSGKPGPGISVTVIDPATGNLINTFGQQD